MDEIIRPGGYIFSIVPLRDNPYDKDRPLTTWQELLERHNNPDPKADLNPTTIHEHFSVEWGGVPGDVH